MIKILNEPFYLIISLLMWCPSYVFQYFYLLKIYRKCKALNHNGKLSRWYLFYLKLCLIIIILPIWKERGIKDFKFSKLVVQKNTATVVFYFILLLLVFSSE